jgi:hypothetical protein
MALFIVRPVEKNFVIQWSSNADVVLSTLMRAGMIWYM